MANFVFMNLGLHGHINPTLALVRELVARGERVDYFAPADFEATVGSTGAAFHGFHSVFSRPVAGHVDSVGRSPMPVRLITECLQALPQLERAVRRCAPDVLAFDVMCLAGRVLGEALGLPTARLASTFLLSDAVAWQPTVARNPEALRFFAAGVEQLAATYGIRRFGLQDVFKDAAELNLVFTTRSFQPEAPAFDRRFHFVGAGLAPAAPRAQPPPAPQLPLVYVALGTLANDRPDFYRACLAALAQGAPKRGLMALGSRVKPADLGWSPPLVETVAHAPQLEVLARASAFVSHAGMNSIMEALYFGVPMVLFPQTEEQVVNAERVAALGAGINLGGQVPPPAVLAEAIGAVLATPGYRLRAEALREELREAGGAPRAADALQAFARQAACRRRPPGRERQAEANLDV